MNVNEGNSTHDVDETSLHEKTLIWCGPLLRWRGPLFSYGCDTLVGGVCMSTKIFISYQIWSRNIRD